MRLLEQLRLHADQRPQATALALVAPDGDTAQSLTYRDYHRAVAATASAINRLSPDNAGVIIQLPNTLTYPVAFLGVLAAGRTVFPLHPALTRHEVAAAAKKAGAQWIISEHAGLDGLTTITPDQVDTWTAASHDAPINTEAFQPGRAAMLLQSSGTTGLPKIVERSAASIDAVAQNVAQAVGLSPHDNVIGAIPLCHSYGIENAVAGPLWAGATLRVCPGFDPETVAALWSRYENVVFPAVPIMIDLFAGREGLPQPGNKLRAVYAAGATLPAPVAQAFFDRYQSHVGQLYGATEIGSVTFGRAADRPLDEGCVGRPMAGVGVRILDLEQPADKPPLCVGKQGQVAVRAPSMLDRYLGPDAPPMVDGHFLTGDLGQLSADSALSITGRVKTLIEVGGMKVNPLEVERVLAEHPGVGECVVVAVQVTQTLSRVTAFYTPADSADPPSVADLRAHAKHRLAAYKVPRAYIAVTSLPRTSLGKVKRQALMEASP